MKIQIYGFTVFSGLLACLFMSSNSWPASSIYYMHYSSAGTSGQIALTTFEDRKTQPRRQDSKPVGYCNEPDANNEWVNAIQKYPEDRDLNYLYSRRIQLCKDVGKGILSEDAASEAFEKERSSIIRQR